MHPSSSPQPEEVRKDDQSMADNMVEAAKQAGSQAVLTPRQTASLRRLLQTAIDQGWTKATLAAELQKRIGLTPRDAAAVENYRKKLIKDGKTRERASKLANDYAKKLKVARGKRLANTEMAQVVGDAQRQDWADQVDSGELGKDAERIFQTHKDERTCPTCRPMHGQRAKIGEPYKGGVTGPPLHPECRCSEKLIKRGR